MKLKILIPVALIFLGGCTTVSSSGRKFYNPATWFSGSALTVVQKTEARIDTARDLTLHDAQVAAEETAEALRAAPVSRPVEVASESNDRARTLLGASLGPLKLSEVNTIKRQVLLLLSDNETLRTEGENLRAKEQRQAAVNSDKLAGLETKLLAASSDLQTSFARENALANELRNEKWWSWFWRISIGTLVLVLGAAYVYMRLQFGGLVQAVGNGMGKLRLVHPQAAQMLEPIVDNLTTIATQHKISSNA